MLVALKQNTFRFLILSHINELLINKGLIINSIKRAASPFNIPRTLKEIEEGLQPAVDPYFTKKIEQILKDLNSFAVSDEDSNRMSATESTNLAELKATSPIAKINDNKFMLTSIWGSLNKDELGTDLTSSLESSFNNYIGICRNIATWAMFLYQKKNDTTVTLGASSVSLLSSKWGPVDLNDDLDNFYNQLFEHIYFYAMEGKISALLDSTPVGISTHQITKKKVKFDEYGYIDIKAPINKASSTYPDSTFYITDIDYIIAEDSYGVPEVTIDSNIEKGNDSVTLRLKEYEGMPICVKEKPILPVKTPLIIDPPIIYPPIPPNIPAVLPSLEGCIAVAFYFDCSKEVSIKSIEESYDFMDKGIYWGAVEGARIFVDNILTGGDAYSSTNGTLTVKSMSKQKKVIGVPWDSCTNFYDIDVYAGLELAINEALSASAEEYLGGRHIVVVSYETVGWNTGETWTANTDIIEPQNERIDYRNTLINRIKDNNLILHIISGVTNQTLIQLVADTGGSYHQVGQYNEALLAMSKKIPEVINKRFLKPVRPIADFIFADITGLNAPQVVLFTNIDEENVVYNWSFGDGSFSSEVNPSHLYSTNGSYTVILAASVLGENNEVISDTIEKTIQLGEAYVTPLKAVMECSVVEGSIPLTVSFYNYSEGLYHAIQWDFGDGTGSIESNPIHIYTSIGTFKPTLTITNTVSDENNTLIPTWSISTKECFELRVTVDITLTVLEKFNFSYDMLVGVNLQKVIFDFDSFKDNCSIDIVSGIQQLPKDLKPVAVIDLKYAGITGDGKYYSPIKIGEDVKWNDSGLLSYEVIPSNPPAIKLTFNARSSFPSASNSNLIISKRLPPYTFTKDTNVLGINAPDGSKHLIEFDVYHKEGIILNGTMSKDWSGSTSYSTLEICTLLNNTFDENQLIAYPDKYNKLVIASLTNSISISSKTEGSTANEVFGFHTSGDIGIPVINAGNIKYKVALYVACISVEGSSPYKEHAISKLIGKHRLITNQIKIISPNYFEAIYGSYPKTIANKVFLPPGHRYIHHSDLILVDIEETTNPPSNSQELISGYFEENTCYDNQDIIPTTVWNPNIAKQFSLFSPYWVGMKCSSGSYSANINLWNEGDDKRFFISKALNTKDNYLELIGNYDFMAPSPVIKNQITAKRKGPYSLPLNSVKNRIVSVRKIAISTYFEIATIIEGQIDSPSLNYINYLPSSQRIQINVGYLENSNNPSYSPRILSTPYAVWEDGDTCSLIEIWDGVGSSFLTCFIDSTYHEGQILSIGYWVDFNNIDTMQADDWFYIELPFGVGTATEIIKAMQRDGDWLRTNNSQMHWTQSTTYLNAANYVILKNNKGDFQPGYKLIDDNGYLRIQASVDFDFRIRIGGSPENCFANNIFGWNPLGELGDKVKATKGPYYIYTYSMETYVSKDIHPSVSGIQPIFHNSQLVKYKEVYGSTKQTFNNEGVPIKDIYNWNICGYASIRQSTTPNLYLELLEKMFNVLCTVRKEGELPPSDEIIPVAISSLSSMPVVIDTKTPILPVTCTSASDFLFLIREDEQVLNLIGTNLIDSLDAYIETGEPSEEMELKYDYPWYDCKEVIKKLAEEVKAIICEGKISIPVCKKCDEVEEVVINNPDLLDLACFYINPILSLPVTSPLLCNKFYSVYPFLLEPIKKTYIPITKIEYYPCSCTERINPLITIEYTYQGKNTLYTTITPIENESLYIEKDYAIDMHLGSLTTFIGIESTTEIMGVYVNDDYSLNSIKKITIDYINKKVIFDLCDIIETQYTVKSGVLINCYSMSGITNKSYVFESTLHGTVTITVPEDKAQITPEYFITLLKIGLSPFQVNYANNIITIDPGNYSLRIVSVPSVDLLSMEEVLLYSNLATPIKVGTSLKVGDTFIGEEILPITITLFSTLPINSSSNNLSAFISG